MVHENLLRWARRSIIHPLDFVDLIMSLTLKNYSALLGVIILVTFLGYGSQICFYQIKPSPLRSTEAIVFNIWLACIWICYFRACFTDAGHATRDWKREGSKSSAFSVGDNVMVPRQRWCRRCEIWKPPRAHHCKTCQR